MELIERQQRPIVPTQKIESSKWKKMIENGKSHEAFRVKEWEREVRLLAASQNFRRATGTPSPSSTSIDLYKGIPVQNDERADIW